MRRQRSVKTKNTKTAQSTSNIFFKILLSFIIIFIVTATIFKITLHITTKSGPSISELPKLEITLSDATIEQIALESKTTKYPNNSVTITTDNVSTTFENVEIKGRGNTTWELPKKPYQIKLSTKANLFNLGESKKWILLADYLDPTHLRNSLAFYIGNLLNPHYPLSGHHAEIYIDDTYHGLYFVTEKVEIAKTRINLKDPDGIIVELDNLYSAENDCLVTASGNCLIIQDYVNSDTINHSQNIFLNDFNEFESALAEKKYSKLSSIIDIDSFATYFLLNEFSVNPDAYSTSFFFYKDGANDKIHAGPGWDFDFAFGNKAWGAEGVDYDSFHSPSNTTILKDVAINQSDTPAKFVSSISDIMYRLLDFPEFQTRIKEIYQTTMSGHQDELLDYIKNQANYIRPAALRDATRWKSNTNFDEEIDALIDWVTKRYTHFEQTYGTNIPVGLEF